MGNEGHKSASRPEKTKKGNLAISQIPFSYSNGAEGWTRTPTGFPTTPSRWRVYQVPPLRHARKIYLIRGTAERQAESKSAESKSAVQGGCFREVDGESPSVAVITPPDILVACNETSRPSAEQRVFLVNRPRPASRAGSPASRISPASGPPPRLA